MDAIPIEKPGAPVAWEIHLLCRLPEDKESITLNGIPLGDGEKLAVQVFKPAGIKIPPPGKSGSICAIFSKIQSA